MQFIDGDSTTPAAQNHLKARAQRRIITLFIVTAAIAGLPAIGGAAEQAWGDSAPVLLTACNFNNYYGSPVNDSSPQTTTGGLELAFVNKSTITATTVKFERVDGNPQEIVDKGVFSSGVTIKHWFRVAGGPSDGDGDWTVTEVDFVDGSTWRA